MTAAGEECFQDQFPGQCESWQTPWRLPAHTPPTAKKRDSVRSWRIKRALPHRGLLSPPFSWTRSVARTIASPATLPQAISNNSPTAPMRSSRRGACGLLQNRKRVTNLCAKSSILHRAEQVDPCHERTHVRLRPFLETPGRNRPMAFPALSSRLALCSGVIAQGIQTSVSFGASNTSSAACGNSKPAGMTPMI